MKLPLRTNLVTGLAVVVVVIERWGPRARRRRAVQPARTRLA